MHYTLRYLLVLIWIAYLICSGVYLFSRGFLLSRIAKKDVNTCENFNDKKYVLNDELLNQKFKDVNIPSNLCLPRKSKVIILMIDALKYDFGIYNENPTNHQLPYENKIRIFHELLKNANESSRLYKFRADPPTTTLQRLKGLTTGSLPTFVDIGSNFATPEINEDNIIDQIIKNNLSIVFLGDDTWTGLYPKRFKRQYAYPSLNIYDLDTVDNEILKNLPNELENNDWDVLIAHFLGVDHCGHRYGPLHQEMSRKLTEMDDMIRMVIDKMDSETTLFVISDHGMTFSGDHGGESEDEVNALLFAYSKGHKLFKIDDDNDLTINQIDLVPTLSTIMGVPIPYSNLGKINFNLVPNINYETSLSEYKLLLFHTWQNIEQIYTYFIKYTSEDKNIQHSMNTIQKEFERLKKQAINDIKSVNDFQNFYKHEFDVFTKRILGLFRGIWIKFDTNQMFHGLIFTVLSIFFTFLLMHQSNSISQFSEIFNNHIISFLYVSNLIGIVIGYLYYKEFSLRNEEHGIIFVTSSMSTIIFVYLILQNWSSIFDVTINEKNKSNQSIFNNIPVKCIFLIFISVFFSNSFIIQEQKILVYLLTSSILIILYEIVKENFIFYEMKSSLKTKFSIFIKSVIFKLILSGIFITLVLRFSYQFFRCREEQMNCNDFIQSTSSVDSTKIHSKKNSVNETKLKVNFLSITILILYTILARIYLRTCGNLTGFSINVLLSRYGSVLSAICASCYILVSNSHLNYHNNLAPFIDRMAWIVYILFALQCCMVFIQPLMVYVIIPNKTKDANLQLGPTYDDNLIIPELFKRIKEAYYDSKDKKPSSSSSDEVPIVYGLATIYSSVLISFGVFLLSLLVILLDGRPSLGFFICIAVAVYIVIAHSISKYQTKSTFNLEAYLQPNFTVIITWLVLTHFTFFATSHQTTLSQIEWRAAFVGRTANYDNSNFISGLLVIINTFSGHLLFMILYSLLVSQSFSIYALFPKLKIKNSSSSLSSSSLSTTTKKILNLKNSNRIRQNKNESEEEYQLNLVNEKSEDQNRKSIEFDMNRGELILYENEKIYIGSVFKLALQFFTLQGSRIFCAMLACTIHCRHLMVWKIFAPRFIYESIGTLISFPAIILGYLIVIRLHLSVKRLIRRINNKK